MQPSEIGGLSAYPKVMTFFRMHLDMQVSDIRSMMRLPLPRSGMDGGCNFAAAAAICNVISGISEVLYTPTDRAGGGVRFKELLQGYFPWKRGEDAAAKSAVIYELIRNPLTHSLGVVKRGSKPMIIEKRPLTMDQIDELETSEACPSWVPLIVETDSPVQKVSVLGLYWGMFRLLVNFVNDSEQMRLADAALFQ